MGAHVLDIGLIPTEVRINLTEQADFDLELTLTDAADNPINWPGGTTLTLEYGGGATVMTATISGAVATFASDKAVNDGIAAATKARLRYVNGTTDRVWWVGKVQRND